MSEEKNNPATPPADPAKTDPPAPPAPAPAPDDKGGEEIDVEKLKNQNAALLKEITEKRHKAKELEGKLSEYEKAKKAAEDEKLAEQGKFKELHEKSLGEMNTLKSQLMRSAVRLFAQENGVIDDVVASSISLDKVTISDTGEVSGAKEAVEAFKKDKPHLFKMVQATQGVGTPKADPPASTPKPPAKGYLTELFKTDRKKYNEEVAKYTKS